MELDDVVEMIVPQPDSQYRLNPCKICGADQAAYLKCKDLFGHLAWKVKCMDCGAESQLTHPIRHTVQVFWNDGHVIDKCIGAAPVAGPADRR